MTKQRKVRQRIPDNTRKAIILACEAGTPHKQVAKLYKVSSQTVDNIMWHFRTYKLGSTDKDIIERNKENFELNKGKRGNISMYGELKKELQDKFTKRCDETLDSISGRDYERASLSQKAVASGIFMEKSLLLAGEPTEIHSQLAQKPTRELIKEFRKHKLGVEDNKDTDIILEHDGSMVVTKKVNDN